MRTANGLPRRLPEICANPSRGTGGCETAYAYCVVSEALTNIVKHARATRAEVTVARLGAILRVAVTDDGAGGAALSGGTGLKELAQRVGSVDGTFRLTSPVGGPT
ncbi:hypothetical protein [Streptomyces sp. NPDC017988]|uniref:hypothetical protein n=1 Tax=Streptomyces sp. NPDC017988 TaxID=3365025 RepID=UPI0037A2B82E